MLISKLQDCVENVGPTLIAARAEVYAPHVAHIDRLLHASCFMLPSRSVTRSQTWLFLPCRLHSNKGTDVPACSPALSILNVTALSAVHVMKPVRLLNFDSSGASPAFALGEDQAEGDWLLASCLVALLFTVKPVIQMKGCGSNKKGNTKRQKRGTDSGCCSGSGRSGSAT